MKRDEIVEVHKIKVELGEWTTQREFIVVRQGAVIKLGLALGVDPLSDIIYLSHTLTLNPLTLRTTNVLTKLN